MKYALDEKVANRSPVTYKASANKRQDWKRGKPLAWLSVKLRNGHVKSHLLNLYKNLRVKMTIFCFTVVCVPDYCFASTINFLESPLVEWQLLRVKK